MIKDLHQSFPRNLTWAALRENPRLLAENVAEHRGVLEAIERGDAAEARRAMSEHVRRARWTRCDLFRTASEPRHPLAARALTGARG